MPSNQHEIDTVSTHYSASGTQSVCLPGWQHKGDLSAEIGSGAAPDGDEDAIVGMILAINVSQ